MGSVSRNSRKVVEQNSYQGGQKKDFAGKYTKQAKKNVKSEGQNSLCTRNRIKKVKKI